MDILGFFDGLFSFFSASRAGQEVSDDDAPHVKPASSEKADKKAEALANQNEQSKQRRKTRVNEAQKQKHELAQQAEQKQQQIIERNQQIAMQRKNRIRTSMNKDYSREREQ